MNFDEYRAIKAINFSALKSMRKSPKHYKWNLDHGSEDTVGRSLGRATHCAVLTPDEWNNEFVVYPGKTRKGKAWDLFEKENSTKTILKGNEAAKVWHVARQVRANPVIAHLLSSGYPEHTLTWTDKITGKLLKCRADFISTVDGKLQVLDLKACQDIRAERFRVEAGKQFYHGQLAFYREGVAANFGGQVAECVLLGVEIAAPYDSAAFKMEETALEIGWEECAEMLQQVSECERTGEWPGCYNAVQEMAIRRWELGLNDNSDIGELGLDFDSDSDDESDG